MRSTPSSRRLPRYNSNNVRTASNSRFYTYCILVAITAIPSFFLGAIVALWAGLVDLECSKLHSFNSNNKNDINWDNRLKEERQRWQVEHDSELQELRVQLAQNDKKETAPLFPEQSMSRVATGMARMNKDVFTSQLDLGVPIDASRPGMSEVLVVYQNRKAMPNNSTTSSTSHAVPQTDKALENCHFVNVILTEHSGTRQQCVAIIPQYESYHVQKWMRLNQEGKQDAEGTLQLVSRGHLGNGRDQFNPPGTKDTEQHWSLLQNYFANVPVVLSELKEILQKIAVDNTVIVMVCNFGQAELLMNFVCAAKSRHLDVSNILVFTTDQETTDLVTSLGLSAYYDERNFGNIPTEAAGRYGDAKFVAMMMAKVICVQLVSMLGYDFLFQDVDIVWFRHPIEYFQQHDDEAKQHDIYFQDDGGHSVRYAPYSANSGFYFVRNNSRTRHFLTSLLMSGDLVLSTNSHQQALIAVLSEHVSLFGLRTKVLSRDTEEFPGGYHYHMKTGAYMKSLFAGEVHPYIFHMSWTKNKDNKLLFLQQMGEWYVEETCVGKKVSEMVSSANVAGTCCSDEPIIRCHYSDKPSKFPCKDSPTIDEGRKSFW